MPILATLLAPMIPTPPNLHLLIKALPQLSSEFRIKFKFLTKTFKAFGWIRLEWTLCLTSPAPLTLWLQHRDLLSSLQTPKLTDTSRPSYLLSLCLDPLPVLVFHIVQITAKRPHLPAPTWPKDSIPHHSYTLYPHYSVLFSPGPFIQPEGIYYSIVFFPHWQGMHSLSLEHLEPHSALTRPSMSICLWTNEWVSHL